MKKLTCIGLAAAISVGTFAMASAKTYNKVLNINNKNKSVIVSTANNKAGIRVLEKKVKSKGDIANVDIKIPVITGMKDRNIQSKINFKLENDILKFKNNLIKSARGDYEEAKKSKYEFKPYEIVVSHEVKYNKGNIMSIAVTCYEYTGGAHGMTEIVTTNINTKTGKYISLKDMFKDRVDYKNIINEKIKKQISANKDKYFIEDNMSFNTIGEEQSFYIQNGNIVVYFGLYEIAPYASGIPEFKIPVSQVKEVLKPEFLGL